MATYYINNGADGDDANDGLARTDSGAAGPWKTFNKAFTVLDAGDTLYVDGTTDWDCSTTSVWSRLYTPAEQTGANDGTSASPITVQQYPGATARITKLGQTAGTNNGWFNMDYWHFKDLTFHQCLNFWLGDDVGADPDYTSTGVVFDNCTFQHTPDTPLATRGQFIGLLRAEETVINNCTFDNIRGRKLDTDMILIRARIASDITITNNTCIDSSADFFHIAESFTVTNITVGSNTCYITRPYVERDEDGNTVATPKFCNVGEGFIDIKSGPGPIYIEDNVLYGLRHSDGRAISNITSGGGNLAQITMASREYTDGQTVLIKGNTTGTPLINGTYNSLTKISATQFTVDIGAAHTADGSNGTAVLQDSDGGTGTAIVLHQSLGDGEYHIRGNLIYDCERAIVAAAYTADGNKGIEIYSNIIILDDANSDAYIASPVGIWNDGARDTIIRNNTILLIPDDANMKMLHFADALDTIDLRNNIIASIAASQVASGWTMLGTPSASNNNCWYQLTSVDADYTDASDMNSNPNIGPAPEWKPLDNTVFAQGDFSGYRDYNGRPFKSPASIGAYEFTSGFPIGKARTDRT